MDMNRMNERAQLSSVLYHDNQGLNKIKHSADQQAALKEVASQFEAMFLQLVLRQMRASSDALADEDNPFSSSQQSVFRDMYDGQLSIEMSKKQRGGIAEILIQQLSPKTPEVRDLITKSFESAFPAKIPDAQDTANDDVCIIKAEARSQSHISPNFSACSGVNSGAISVAQHSKAQGEMPLTAAFSQPLIRPLER